MDSSATFETRCISTPVSFFAYIPESFTIPLKEPFDTEYMKELFQVGYDLAANGYPWAKVPPGYTAPEVEPPLDSQQAVQ